MATSEIPAVRRRDGVAVIDLVPRGAAEKAGLRAARFDEEHRLDFDVIAAIDGEPVETSDDLYRIIDEHQVGDRVKVTVLRGEGTLEFVVTLQALNP